MRYMHGHCGEVGPTVENISAIWCLIYNIIVVQFWFDQPADQHQYNQGD